MEQFIEDFVDNGFVAVRGAVEPETLQACLRVIEGELRARSVDPDDPATWTEPVVRLPCPEGSAFAAAGTSPVLWRTYDALLGSGRWARRHGVGGTIPIRFPSSRDPGDAGWPGDVYVCHPFIVHRATWPHRGVTPRIIAQPGIAHHPPFTLDDESTACAVEQAILRGLGQQ